MQEKKYFFIIFLGFVWQKLNFFFNKTTKYSLMGVCQTHPKTQKPFNKIYGKPNRVLKPLTHFFLLDSIKLTRLGWPEIFGLTINRARNPSLTRKQPKKKPKIKHPRTLKKNQKNLSKMNQTQKKMNNTKNSQENRTNPATWNPKQTKFDQNEGIYMLEIMQGSVIWHLFTSIIT
jgi:hypothetical protein